MEELVGLTNLREYNVWDLSNAIGEDESKPLENLIGEFVSTKQENAGSVVTDEEYNFRLPELDWKLSPDYVRKNHSTTLQKWKGVVNKVSENTFQAILDDMSNPGTKESVDLDLEDISPDDQSLVSEGAIFYWTINRSYRKGQVTKDSVIKFLRPLYLDSEDFDQVMDEVDQFSSLFPGRIG